MKTFKLPLTVRIHLAERRAADARRQYETLGKRLAVLVAYGDSDPERPAFSGLEAMRVMCAQSEARRAMWAAEDTLAALRAFGSTPYTGAPRHAL